METDLGGKPYQVASERRKLGRERDARQGDSWVGSGRINRGVREEARSLDTVMQLQSGRTSRDDLKVSAECRLEGSRKEADKLSKVVNFDHDVRKPGLCPEITAYVCFKFRRH